MNIPEDGVIVSFPDLSPAEASVLAKELRLELTKAGVPQEKLRIARTDNDAQDMGTLIEIIGSAWFLDMLGEASKGFVKGVAAGAGRATFDWLLRKYGTSAKIERREGPPIVIGEEHSRPHSGKPSFPPQRLSDLKSLGLVLLGADKFPYMPAHKNLDNPAFKNSAEAARELFSSKYTLFRETHILDLFNTDYRTDEIVDQIAAFASKHDQIRDIILYYVGHGDFLAQQDRRYYLLLKNTRSGREPTTGLTVRDFRSMIEDEISDRRCYFFLDSCFAAAAVDAFQFEGVEAAVSAQFDNEILPARGWAFLAASDRDVPAIGKDGTGHTMFNGALSGVLKGEGWQRSPALTLDDLSAEMGRYINHRHGSKGVRPQCHAPQQADGDISRLPLFVLPAHKTEWHIPTKAPQTASPEETAAYEALMKAPDIVSCEQFLQTWPNSPYAMAVRPLLERLRQEAAVQAQREKQELERRLREEEARRQREAKQRFEQEAASIWAQLEVHGDQKAIEDFIGRYGNTPSAVQARQKLAEVQRREKAVSPLQYEEESSRTNFTRRNLMIGGGFLLGTYWLLSPGKPRPDNKSRRSKTQPSLRIDQSYRTFKGHEDGVNSVAFSSDGRTLASSALGYADKTIRLWDAGSGRLIRTLKGNENLVFSIAFSPDGRTIASGGGDNTIKLWDADSGRLIRTLKGHGSSVKSVAFSPDGRTLASGGGDNTIKLWDAGSGRLIRTLKGYGKGVFSVTFSPDGSMLASGNYKIIRLWDAGSGRLIRTLKGHHDAVSPVAFSPDGRMLASVSYKTIRLWDADSGRLIRTLKGHGSSVKSVAFSPDRRTLASGGGDNTIKLWEASSGHLIQTLKGHFDSVISAAFSPDGRTLASGSDDKTIKLWRIK